MTHQYITITTFFIVIYLVKSMATYDISLGTGSSRLDESVASEFNKIVDDTEHIKEDFEDLFTQNEVDEMEPDRIAFTWYTAHNTNDDDGLDGLELLKAISHAHAHEIHEAQHAEHDGRPNDAVKLEEEDLKTMDFDEEIGLVDALLGTYDQNDNGLLEYVEFITAFKESRHQLGI